MEIALNQEVYEFAVYAKRLHMVKYLVFFFFCDLLSTALLLFCLFLASGLPFIRPNPFPLVVTAVQILMVILSVLVLFIVIWIFSFMFFTIRGLVSHKPILLITYQGIDFHDLPLTGNTFLLWSEIASLCIIPVHQSYSKPHNHLCLDPKNHVQFLSRFHPLQRFFVNLGSIATGNLIHAPQWFLAAPVEEILLQIQETFQEELLAYDVQVFGTYSEKESY